MASPCFRDKDQTPAWFGLCLLLDQFKHLFSVLQPHWLFIFFRWIMLLPGTGQLPGIYSHSFSSILECSFHLDNFYSTLKSNSNILSLPSARQISFLFFVFPESLMATFVTVYTPVNFMIVCQPHQPVKLQVIRNHISLFSFLVACPVPSAVPGN